MIIKTDVYKVPTSQPVYRTLPEIWELFEHTVFFPAYIIHNNKLGIIKNKLF